MRRLMWRLLLGRYVERMRAAAPCSVDPGLALESVLACVAEYRTQRLESEES